MAESNDRHKRNRSSETDELSNSSVNLYNNNNNNNEGNFNNENSNDNSMQLDATRKEADHSLPKEQQTDKELEFLDKLHCLLNQSKQIKRFLTEKYPGSSDDDFIYPSCIKNILVGGIKKLEKYDLAVQFKGEYVALNVEKEENVSMTIYQSEEVITRFSFLNQDWKEMNGDGEVVIRFEGARCHPLNIHEHVIIYGLLKDEGQILHMEHVTIVEVNEDEKKYKIKQLKRAKIKGNLETYISYTNVKCLLDGTKVKLNLDWFSIQRPIFNEILDHKTNESLRYFLSSIKIDAGLFSDILSSIQLAIDTCIPGAFIRARGSYATNTALKYRADLDLDLILPRSLFSTKTIGIGSFTQIVVQCVYEALEKHNLFKSPTKSKYLLTRSLSYTICHPSLELFVDVDLFPKIIYTFEDDYNSQYKNFAHSSGPSSDGITGPVRLFDQTLVYDIARPYQEPTKPELIDNEIRFGVVALIKLWKYQKKQIQDHFKSYHISLALEKVIEIDYQRVIRRQSPTTFSQNVRRLFFAVLAFLYYAYKHQITKESQDHIEVRRKDLDENEILSISAQDKPYYFHMLNRFPFYFELIPAIKKQICQILVEDFKNCGKKFQDQQPESDDPDTTYLPPNYVDFSRETN